MKKIVLIVFILVLSIKANSQELYEPFAFDSVQYNKSILCFTSTSLSAVRAVAFGLYTYACPNKVVTKRWEYIYKTTSGTPTYYCIPICDTITEPRWKNISRIYKQYTTGIYKNQTLFLFQHLWQGGWEIANAN